jgi:ABC-type Fe3+/spermidine/putrescine transport system ATPase subunit
MPADPEGERTLRVAARSAPFSAMDAELRDVLMAEARSFAGELRIPAIHVTPQKDEACALGDRAELLRAGRAVALGGVVELLGGPKRPGDEG